MPSRRSPTRPVRPQFLVLWRQISFAFPWPGALNVRSTSFGVSVGDRPVRLARGVAAGVAQAGPRGGQRQPRRRAVDPDDLALPTVLLGMQLQHHLLQGRLRALVGRRLRVRCDTPETPVTSRSPIDFRVESVRPLIRPPFVTERSLSSSQVQTQSSSCLQARSRRRTPIAAFRSGMAADGARRLSPK
eukprot:SAG11_NODE_284_length_11240_cov_6.333812_7_plen_188_part_00